MFSTILSSFRFQQMWTLTAEYGISLRHRPQDVFVSSSWFNVDIRKNLYATVMLSH